MPVPTVHPFACQVALPLPLPQAFDYLPAAGIASRDAAIGGRVRVPFGNRELVGVVVGCGPVPDGAELRPVLGQLDPEPLFHGELLQSLRWLARYTHTPLGEVLATALPAALRRGDPLPETHAWAWQLTEAGHAAWTGLRTGKPRQRDQDFGHVRPHRRFRRIRREGRLAGSSPRRLAVGRLTLTLLGVGRIRDFRTTPRIDRLASRVGRE